MYDFQDDLTHTLSKTKSLLMTSSCHNSNVLATHGRRGHIWLAPCSFFASSQSYFIHHMFSFLFVNVLTMQLSHNASQIVCQCHITRTAKLLVKNWVFVSLATSKCMICCRNPTDQWFFNRSMGCTQTHNGPLPNRQIVNNIKPMYWSSSHKPKLMLYIPWFIILIIHLFWRSKIPK